jgi:Transglutaminase-like enzymes, putative cysteine proteases
MFYSIRHSTRFRYSTAVSESLMEVRMHPRTEGTQRCLTFQLSVSPKARVTSYRDYLGNTIHHFDVPGHHNELMIVAESLVDSLQQTELGQLGVEAWDELDALVADGDYWEMLAPSHFAQPSELLRELSSALGVERRGNPLGLLLELNAGIYNWFDYTPKSTRVDSPIDDALRTRQGVCQDFAHIMLALTRELRIPCRYVSGYLYHGSNDKDRSSEGATHAWVEALLPRFGWVGFDPTNNLLTSERHIRTAIGRDYADVPPTRGVFKGQAESELAVSVRVAPSDSMPEMEDEFRLSGDWSTFLEEGIEELEAQQQQQQ